MKVQRWLATMLLAMAGTVWVHWLVYSAIGPVLSDGLGKVAGHGYVPIASGLVIPFGVVAICWHAVRSSRAAFEGRELTASRLGGYIAALFVGQEFAEQVSTGTLGHGVGALALGVILAFPVSWLIGHVVKTAAEIVREFSVAPNRVVHGARPATSVDVFLSWVERPQSRPSLGRGPPCSF